MKNPYLVRIVIVAIGLAVAFFGFSFTPKSEMQTESPTPTPPPATATVVPDIQGYRSWRVATRFGAKMDPSTAQLCIIPMQPIGVSGTDLNASPHKDRYIRVFVNGLGVKDMFSKKRPKFPVGTVIVKEKLTEVYGEAPELLTVMKKREKGYNPEVGDWEFLAVTGDGTEIKARGKLESCGKCHADYPANDYVTRAYLSESYRKSMK